LLDDEGKAVGINFASTDSDRFLAIGRDEAEPIISQLHTDDVQAIGVNGEAFLAERVGLSGIRVASVNTDSPAFEAGLRGVEISEVSGEPLEENYIIKLEGTRLAEDGTKTTYCNILRSHSSDDSLEIEVERWIYDPNGDLEDIAIYDGVLNGEHLKRDDSKTEARLTQIRELMRSAEATTGEQTTGGQTTYSSSASSSAP